MKTSDPVAGPPLPMEQFATLDALPVRHGLVGRVPGVDVRVDRALALERLGAAHRQARHDLGVGERKLITAEQIHGGLVATFAAGDPLPTGAVPRTDSLVTDRAEVCLGIYVADCCPVYFVDPVRRVVGLAHSGRKGTEANIASATVEAMQARFGTRPGDVVAQLGPCIRPPWYEVDIAPLIVGQCRALGLSSVVDCGACTAADPDRYYSYRREKGRTGRMLALLALR